MMISRTFYFYNTTTNVALDVESGVKPLNKRSYYRGRLTLYIHNVCAQFVFTIIFLFNKYQHEQTSMLRVMPEHPSSFSLTSYNKGQQLLKESQIIMKIKGPLLALIAFLGLLSIYMLERSSLHNND